MAARTQVGRKVGTVHAAREQDADVVVLVVEAVELLLNLAVDVLRGLDRDTLVFVQRPEILVLEALGEVHAVLPDIAEGDVGAEAKVLVCHSVVILRRLSHVS